MNSLTLFNPLERKMYNGQPVVTLKDIDRIHQKPEGSAGKRFNDNKRHFIEGTDYYRLNAAQVSEFRSLGIGSNFGGIILTLTGYLMIVKSFTDDLSWAVQRELVTGYFAGRRAEYTFMGTPVLPLKEAARLLGIDAKAAGYRLAKSGRFGMADALLLEGRSLERFKRENALNTFAKGMWIITAQGLEKLRRK